MISEKEVAALPAIASLQAKGYCIANIHRYLSSEGQELFCRVRLEHPTDGKTIRPVYRAAGDVVELGEPGHLKAGLKPLYGLHALTSYPNAHVWVVEGEKCADSLNSAFKREGVWSAHVAVTSGSATSADKADWAPLLDREVTIWPDNDESGSKYAATVSETLVTLGCKISAIAATELGLAPGQDCVDWLAANPSAVLSDLLALPKKAEATALETELTASETELTAPEVEADASVELQRLASMSAIDYDKVREAEANRLGIRVGTLDKEVKAARKPSKAMDDLFTAVDPWPDPVDLSALLDDILNAIRRHIVCDEETAIAATLWCAFTWVIDHVQVAPLAVITAPEKRCGKSQMLDVLGRMSRRPLIASSISPAATFRVIEACCPTMLIDEADAFLRDNEELRGIINSGHTRQSAYVIRSVGETHEPTRFSTWGAKALSGIGSLADTIMDRAIMLRLRRKLPHESVERLRHADPALFTELSSKLARFALDAGEAIGLARPSLPNGLNDRAQDNWEPLLAIADHAGGLWPSKARAAALAIADTELEASSASAELLADIQAVFEDKSVTKISTKDMLAALCEDEERSWSTYNRGKPMTPRQLSKSLQEYGIKAKTVRIAHGTPRGFDVEQFEDVFSRYLPPAPPVSATTPQTAHTLDEAVLDEVGCFETAGANETTKAR